MRNKIKISDLDTKIIALLYRRIKKDGTGFGTYLIQKKINQSGSKKFENWQIVNSIDNLCNEKILKYDNNNFWVLTDKGMLYAEECEEKISGFRSLMIKLYT